MSKGGQNVKNHNKKMSIFHAYFQILGGFCAEASARFDTLSLSKFDHRQQDVRHCRVTRCRLEFLGSHRSVICSIGDVFGGGTRFCVFSRVFIFLRIFAEFSRQFARKVHEEPHGLGLRFFFYTIAKVFRRVQVARDSFSLLKPRKLRSRFSKFRIFALIVLLRLEANFEFQKCAVTSPTFLTYRV